MRLGDCIVCHRQAFWEYVELCDPLMPRNFLKMELGCIKVREHPGKGLLHHFHRVFGHARIPCLDWPVCDGRRDVLNDRRHAPGVEAVFFAKACDLSARRAATFALDVEVVLAARAGRVGEVERRRQAPLARRIHEVGMLARMVVPIAGEHVENHPPERGGDVIRPPRDGARRAEEEIVT